MKIKEILVVIGLILWLGSCYTQFQTLEERYPAYPRKADASVDTDDTTYVEEDSLGEKDTVVVTEREVCYWERTFFGDWELRCYDSNYPEYWHRYYNRPWWYRSYNYDPYDCHCPYHVFYHPNCEYCWHYCDRFSYHGGGYIYDHYPHNTSTGSTPTGSPGASPVKGKNVGSGRKGDNKQPDKPVIGPTPNKIIPSSTPTAPVKPVDGGNTSTGKKPNENISDPGKIPQDTNNSSSKPDKVNRKSKNKRFGRRR